MKNTRNYERHVKATSGDLSNLDTNTADVAMPMTAVKMDSSGRFTSANPPRVVNKCRKYLIKITSVFWTFWAGYR
jgi:hypothetical protein